jgi:hypothetical protein
MKALSVNYPVLADSILRQVSLCQLFLTYFDLGITVIDSMGEMAAIEVHGG